MNILCRKHPGCGSQRPTVLPGRTWQSSAGPFSGCAAKNQNAGHLVEREEEGMSPRISPEIE